MKHKIGDKFRCEYDVYPKLGKIIRKGEIVTVCGYTTTGSYLLAEHPSGRFGMYSEVWTKLQPIRQQIDTKYEALYE